MQISVEIKAPELTSAIQALASAIENNSKTITLDSQAIGSAVETKKPVQGEKQEPQSTPVEEKEPEKEETASKISLETVRVKLAELSQNGKQKEVKGLITSLGYKKLSDVPEDKYAELLEKAEGL